MRLSASSFAGTARTLVAVGSCSDAVMFFAIAFAAPRSGFVVWSASAPAPGWAALAGLVVPAGGLLGVSPLREEVVRAPSVAGAAGEPVPVVLPAGALPFAETSGGRPARTTRCSWRPSRWTGRARGRPTRRHRRVPPCRRGPRRRRRPAGRPAGRHRRAGCRQGRSRRRTRATPCRPRRGRRGSAGTSRRPATRWVRTGRSGYYSTRLEIASISHRGGVGSVSRLALDTARGGAPVAHCTGPHDRCSTCEGLREVLRPASHRGVPGRTPRVT